jgi:hypothetical protein
MITHKTYELIEDSYGKRGLLKNKNKKNKNLAVFVHGFTGNYLSTWGNFPELLTRDPRLHHYDFLFWGYSSNFLIPREDFFLDNVKQLFTQFLSRHKTNQHIEIVAQGLQTELKYLEDYDNIKLIGHSLGGLIIRSYIIKNLKENNKKNLEKINQIILFGTPNEGLNVANNKLLGSLNNQIQDMGSYNEFINLLREDWVELVFKNKEIKFSTLMVAGEDDYFVPFEQVTKYFRDSRELTKGDHFNMVKPKSTHDMSYKIIANNLLKINRTSFFELHDKKSSSITGEDSRHLSELLQKIKKLIADRGLDDRSWTQTLPSQYFLIRLARLLKLDQNSDYLSLLDSFLKNYYMKVDNKIILSGKQGLDTAEEMIEIRKSMIEEDKKDDYYSRYNKNAAENIDIDLLHDNYHYGLMAQIAYSNEFPDSLTLKLIQELAIGSLIYGNGKQPTNDHGGWYPQRLPWLTARILIGLKNSGYENRDDKNYIEEISSKANEYLIRSIYQDQYWRSGINDWVTDWESTALCLEALDQWGKIIRFEPQIKKVLQYIFENEQKWLLTPSFDSEVNSNKSLAAVTLLCTTIVVVNNYFHNNFDLEYGKYLKYLSNVLDQIIDSSKIPVKQYSTIHQITFYIARLITKLDHSLIDKTFPKGNREIRNSSIPILASLDTNK